VDCMAILGTMVGCIPILGLDCGERGPPVGMTLGRSPEGELAREACVPPMQSIAVGSPALKLGSKDWGPTLGTAAGCTSVLGFQVEDCEPSVGSSRECDASARKP